MKRLLLCLCLACVGRLVDGAEPGKVEPAVTTNVRDIGSRRELFVDRFLVERLENTSLKLHEPQLTPSMAEPADKLEYGTVIKDGNLFRLYTRDGRGAKFDGDSSEVTRYCESRDGNHWSKPNLGVIDYRQH